MRRGGLCLILFLFLIQLTIAQSGKNSLPVSPVPQNTISYYTDIITLINPAAPQLKEKFTLNSKVGSFTGIRKNISEYYIDGWIKFKDEEKVAIGAQFYSSNQGPFIHFQTGKLYPRYSIRLSENWRVNTAVGVGFMSYAFEGNNATAGGADMIADVDAGICVQSDKWNIGVSRMHIINNHLQPILASFHKNRLLNGIISRTWRINEDVDLATLGVVSANLATKEVNYDATIETIYKKKLKMITLLYHTNLLGLGGGIHKINTAIGDFSMNFIYTVGVSKNNSINSNRYEIGFSYQIGKY